MRVESYVRVGRFAFERVGWENFGRSTQYLPVVCCNMLGRRVEPPVLTHCGTYAWVMLRCGNSTRNLECERGGRGAFKKPVAGFIHGCAGAVARLPTQSPPVAG